MKPILVILPIVAVTAVIGWTRQSHLDRLNHENIRLEKSTPASLTRSQRNERPPALSAAEASEIQSLASQLVAMIATAGDPGADHAAQQAIHKTLQEKLSRLSHQSIRRLIEASTDGMTDQQKAALYQVYVQTLAPINPQEALQLLAILPAYDGKQLALMYTFQQTVAKNPSLAVRSFEQMDEADDPAIRHLQILKFVFAAQARLEPEVAVSRILSPKGAELLPEMRDLPRAICDELRDASEHRAFLSALRTEGLKFPGSSRLEYLRSGYIGSLSQKMVQWPFEDAMSLAESEFTPKESQALAMMLPPGKNRERVLKVISQKR